MGKVEWKDLDGLGPATPDQVVRVEARVGHEFPEDVRAVLLQNQGMKPEPNAVEVFAERPPKGFGTLGNCVDGEVGNIADFWESMRGWNEDPYPTWLVPISIGRGLAHFALDYRDGEASPSIVWVNTDVVSEDRGFVTPVASSFTQLLEMLE